MTRLLFSAALLALGLLAFVAAQEKPEDREVGLVVYKLGEQYATDDKAGKAIDKFTAWLDGELDDLKFKRRGVRNKPDEALKLFKDEEKPVGVAIVSPPFYLEHKKDLKLKVVAEATRGGNNGERYTLVGADEVEEYPAGKRIATTMTADEDWLNKVVLRKPEDAKPVKWVQHDNLMDAGYEIIDEDEDAPDYVLVDRVTLEFFDKDLDLKTLKKGLQSEVLPQDLVVEVDEALGDARDDFEKVLRELDKTEKGKKIGELLQSPKFPAPDDKRLKRVEKWYNAE